MIKSLKVFAVILGFPQEKIKALLADLDDPIKARKYQHIFFILKSNGKKRPIVPSTDILKEIQKRIKDRIFNHVEFPHYITGGLKKRSGVINGKIHRGSDFYFQTDLSSFFSNVSCQMVYESLSALGFSADVAYAIMRLTTYKGYLAQGPSTSPFLANLVGLKIDKAVVVICEKFDLKYTRFVDDLTFSCKSDFKNITLEILQTVEDCGFRYNHAKTHYRIGKTQVTGVVTGKYGVKGTKDQIAKFNDPKLDICSFQGIKGYLSYISKINKNFDVNKYKETFGELIFPEKIYPRSSEIKIAAK